MSAPFTRRLICVSFSIWNATRSSTTSRIPAASPASTIETKSREKIFGWRASASESISPPSTSARTSPITAANFRSSVCSSRMTSAVTTFRPASTMVANWREKIWSDFGLTFFPTPLIPAVEAARSLRSTGSRPRTRSASRAPFRSGALISPTDSSPSALIAV